MNSCINVRKRKERKIGKEGADPAFIGGGKLMGKRDRNYYKRKKS